MEAVGARGLTWLLSRVARTRNAVYARARIEFQKGGFTRGAYTLSGLKRETGYTREQLLRARDALNQKWRRTRPRGAYLIQHEQMEDIVAWLQHDYWCKPLRLYACIQCGTKEERPRGLGLCTPCYNVYRGATRRLGLPSAPKALSAAVAEHLSHVAGTDAVFLEMVRDWCQAGRAVHRVDLERVASLL